MARLWDFLNELIESCNFKLANIVYNRDMGREREIWLNEKRSMSVRNADMNHQNGWESAQVAIIGIHLLKKWKHRTLEKGIHLMWA